MIENLIVFAIVGIAGYFTIRKLWRETIDNGCAGCNCAGKNKELQKLTRRSIRPGDDR